MSVTRSAAAPLGGSVATRGSSPPPPWGALLRELAGDRVDRIVFASSAAVVGLAYSVLLPFAFTQRISLANWHYLDARYVAFAVGFGIAFAWLITVQVHATRSVLGSRSSLDGGSGPIGALAAVVSALPSLLCCSPILPTLVATFGLSSTTSLQLQYVFATREDLFLFGTLALLIATGLWSMRKLARAACLSERGCALPSGLAEGANSVSEQAAQPTASRVGDPFGGGHGTAGR